MKKVFMILVTIFIMVTLVACGNDKITSNTPTNGVVATPDSTTETQQNKESVTNEAIESNNQSDTLTDEGLAAYAGAYTDGTNYLVIEGEDITLNGHKCEVTRVVTDHFKSGVPVYYFTYENSEVSIYYDEVCGMGCSLGQSEGSWLTYETIDIAQVPHFDVEDEQNNEQDGETVSPEPTTSEYPFVGVTYKHRDLDIIFQLKTPDADGNPTEVLLSGEYYDVTTFNNETFVLSDLKITASNQLNTTIYTIQAFFYSDEQKYEFFVEGDGSIWRMRSPYEDDFFPE